MRIEGGGVRMLVRILCFIFFSFRGYLPLFCYEGNQCERELYLVGYVVRKPGDAEARLCGQAIGRKEKFNTRLTRMIVRA